MTCVADVLIYVPPRHILCSGILCTSDQCFGTIEESRRSNYCRELPKEFYDMRTEFKLHHTQLSLIQLSGAIAVGVNTKQRKYYSLLRIPERRVLEGISIGVWTTCSQVRFQLSNDISPQIWTIGSSLCDIIIAICMTYYVSFSHFPPLLELLFPDHDGSFRDMILPSRKPK